MRPQVFKRLKSFDVEGFRTDHEGWLQVVVKAKWISTDGAVVVDRCELSFLESYEDDLWVVVATELRKIADKL